MDIRLQKPDPGLRLAIIGAATAGGCLANIKRCELYHSTFTLEQRGGRQAPFEVQDTVIEALLSVYPDATIRTARAIYEGAEDFNSQRKARVPI